MARLATRKDPRDGPVAVLQTPRLRLEPLRASHADALFDGLADARLYAHLDERPPASLEALRERYGRWERRRSPDGAEAWLNWVLVTLADGCAVGYVQATVFADGSATIGYMLVHGAWKNGYAREGVAAMVEALRARGVGPLRATVDVRNDASVRLLEAIGFVRSIERADAGPDDADPAGEAEYRWPPPH